MGEEWKILIPFISNSYQYISVHKPQNLLYVILSKTKKNIVCKGGGENNLTSGREKLSLSIPEKKEKNKKVKRSTPAMVKIVIITNCY